jgi:hypothetical protein
VCGKTRRDRFICGRARQVGFIHNRASRDRLIYDKERQIGFIHNKASRDRLIYDKARRDRFTYDKARQIGFISGKARRDRLRFGKVRWIRFGERGRQGVAEVSSETNPSLTRILACRHVADGDLLEGSLHVRIRNGSIGPDANKRRCPNPERHFCRSYPWQRTHLATHILSGHVDPPDLTPTGLYPETGPSGKGQIVDRNLARTMMQAFTR